MRGVREQFYKGLFGLQFRTTILLTAIVLAATGLTGATYLRISTQLIVEEAASHARDLARAIAASSSDELVAQDQNALLSLASEAVNQGGLTYVVFADLSGQMLASYQKGAGSINHLLMNDARHISVEPLNHPTLISDGPIPCIDVVYPVCHKISGCNNTAIRHTAGYVRLGVSMVASDARLQNLVRTVIGLAVGIALLMVPMGYQVVRHLAAPIERLSAASQEFAKGNLQTRVEINRRDEIGELSQSFNTMADEMARSHNQLVKLNAELEDRVLQRTNALEEANRALREMASRDSLTGLYNRRHFNDLLGQLFAESSRYGTDLTCMMIDLDNFKRVNDTLGHQTGDHLLQLTADVIQGSVRESDVAVRYGGDEFAVLLPQTSPSEARNSADRIIENFRAQMARHLPTATTVSLSIGLVSREGNQPSSATELLSLADEALYFAKAGGRNRINVARPTGSRVYRNDTQLSAPPRTA